MFQFKKNPATGKKPTIKEMVQNMKKMKIKLKELKILLEEKNKWSEVIKRQGEIILVDDIDPKEYASGGRGRFFR